MNNPRPNLAARILLLAPLLVGIYTAWWATRPTKPELAENNYAANMLRIERYCFGPPASVALVGSSLTGRLLPSYFAPARVGTVVNLALDGSGPLQGLQILEQSEAIPRVVLVEANLLMKLEGENERTLRAAMGGFTFKLARWCPLLRVEARPSTRLYAWLKTRRDRAEGSETPGLQAPTPVALPAPEDLATKEHEQALRDGLRGLANRGAKILLFRMPTGQRWSPLRTPDSADELARELGLPLMDLSRELRTRNVPLAYTDGLHLSGHSARMAAMVLTELFQARVGQAD